MTEAEQRIWLTLNKLFQDGFVAGTRDTSMEENIEKINQATKAITRELESELEEIRVRMLKQQEKGAENLQFNSGVMCAVIAFDEAIKQLKSNKEG